MVKHISETFPKLTQKFRLRRGLPAGVKLHGHPSVREFFEGVASSLVSYKETHIASPYPDTSHGETLSVTAFYHDQIIDPQQYGLLSYRACVCSDCGGHPINKCSSGDELYRTLLSVAKRIHWFTSLEVCLATVCKYTHDMTFIHPMMEYLYPNAEERKYATRLQQMLIFQDKDLVRLRALERARDIAARPNYFNEILNAPINRGIVYQGEVAPPREYVEQEGEMPALDDYREAVARARERVRLRQEVGAADNMVPGFADLPNDVPEPLPGIVEEPALAPGELEVVADVRPRNQINFAERIRQAMNQAMVQNYADAINAEQDQRLNDQIEINNRPMRRNGDDEI